MSSLKSLAPADAGPALELALIDVAEQSFCGFADPCTPAMFAELLENTGEQDTPWLRATVVFAGRFEGAIVLDVPESLAGELRASCLGIDAAEADADPSLPGIEDAVGEFANMVCGTWLTRSFGEDKFDLRAPALEHLRDEHRARWAAEPPATLLLSLNDRPLRLRVAC
jgi:CheY-specific phosphatase CheX